MNIRIKTIPNGEKTKGKNLLSKYVIKKRTINNLIKCALKNQENIFF